MERRGRGVWGSDNMKKTYKPRRGVFMVTLYVLEVSIITPLRGLWTVFFCLSHIPNRFRISSIELALTLPSLYCLMPSSTSGIFFGSSNQSSPEGDGFAVISTETEVALHKPERISSCPSSKRFSSTRGRSLSASRQSLRRGGRGLSAPLDCDGKPGPRLSRLADCPPAASSA